MLFIKNLRFSPAPWRIFHRGRGHIVDQNDNIIATVPKPGAIDFEQREANLRLITHAPEILAALLEAAYHLHSAGTPLRPELLDLIDRVRGPKFKPLRNPKRQRDPTQPDDNAD